MANVIQIVINASDQASAVLTNVGATLNKVSSGLTAAGSALMQATAPIAAFLQESVAAASQMETTNAQLQAVLKSTGGVAGVTANAAQSLATQLSQVTRFSDDNVLSAENMLLTFTNIGSNIFPDVTKATLDLSTAMNQDLKSSAVQLGKALNDPVNGMTALTRVGVTFTQAQKDAVKQMVETNNIAGAQAIILKEVQREFGGSAVAAGQTMAGQMDILNNRMEQFQEKIGGIVSKLQVTFIPIIEKVIDTVSDWIDKNPQLAQTILAVLAGLTALAPVLIIVGQAISGVGTIIEVVGGALGGLGDLAFGPIGLLIAAGAALVAAWNSDFGGIRETLKPFIDGVSSAFKQVQQLFSDVGSAFQRGGPTLAIKQFFADLEDGSTLVTKFLTSLGVSPDTAQQISTGFGKVVGVIDDTVQSIMSLITKAVGFVEANLPLVPFYFSYYFGKIWSVVQPVVQPILDWFTGSDPNNSLGGAIQNVLTWINRYIIEPFKGIWVIIQPAIKPILDWFIGTANSFISSVKAGWDFFTQYFLNPILSIGSKITTALAPVVSAIETLFQPVIDIINKALDSWEILRRAGGGAPMRTLPGESSPGVQGAVGNATFAQLAGSVSNVVSGIASAFNSAFQNYQGVQSFAQSLPSGSQDFLNSQLPSMVPSYQVPLIQQMLNASGTSAKGSFSALPAVTGTAANPFLTTAHIHDYPGSYSPGTAYVVGTGAQPEVFYSGASGGYAQPNGGSRRGDFTWNGDMNIPPNSKINITREQLEQWMDDWAEKAGIYG